jgi:hypothetical protein
MHLDKDRIANRNYVSMFGAHRRCERLVDRVSLRAYLAQSFESVAAPGENIDAVDLDTRVTPQIGDGSRRRDIGEQQVIVVVNPQRAFR